MIKILILVFISSGASAYQLGDHSRILQQAYSEFVRCYPDMRSQWGLDALLDGDLGEDTNLIEKELFFSHYYNPHRNLNMWRGDSAGRIDDLLPALMQCRTANTVWHRDELVQLGHALHHFQDMTVPAHVVPITHSFWDGFEEYDFSGEISSGWSCDDLRASSPAGLMEILKSTSEATLTAVNNWHVEAQNVDQDKPLQIAGKDFWFEPQGDGFGDYGALGNSFGISEIHAGEDLVRVRAEDFALFKQGQMKAAVRASLLGMLWALRP